MLNKQQLGFISRVQLINNGSAQLVGSIHLTKEKNLFYLSWIPNDGLPSSHITSIFEDVKSDSNTFDQSEGFHVLCNEITLFSFLASDKSDDDKISLVLDFNNPYKFQISVHDIYELSEFIESLLIHGIAVPKHDEEMKYSFFFYDKAASCTMACPPTYMQLNISEFENIDAFWKKIMDFYVKLMVEIFNNDSLPNDPYFPYGKAAVSAQFLVEQEINEFIGNLPNYEPLSKEEFKSMFDENGVVKDKVKFLERLYFGVSDDIRKEVLPYALGCFPLDFSTNERKELIQKRNKEFDILRKQVESIGSYQLSHNKKLSSSFRVINHDVERTDRGNPAFIKSKGPGLELLTLLLRTYCLYHMKIGYLQGMNDLFVPIILTYFPKWNDDGFPVDDNNNVINIDDYISEIFWCYEGMIKNINHLELLSDVKQQCTLKAKIIIEILDKVSPMISVWLKNYDLNSLLWIYSDFVLLYKRTYSNIWNVWLQLNCSKDPKNWLLYFISAIIILTFPNLAKLKDINITTIMGVFPNELEKLDPNQIGKYALWIYQKAPIPKEEQEESKKNCNNFNYFKFNWENN